MKQSNVAEIQLVYRPKVKPSLRPRIKSTKDAADIFIKGWDMDKIDLIEQFKVMLLTITNSVLGVVEVSTGGINGTIADPKIILGSAVKAGAYAIILAHNHPSGHLKPSQPDVNLTARIKEGAKLLEISLLDHIIVTSEDYLSFAYEGLL